MSARAGNRLRALAGAALGSLRPRLRARPRDPAKILVLHELLLGDTLMLAPLLAALRERHPEAEILVTARPEHVALFAGRPWGARALPWSERRRGAHGALIQAKGCDLALLPGEGRHALVARALGAKWIVAFAGARPAWRARLVDEQVDFPASPAALGDLFARLAGGPPVRRYRAGDWPVPPCAPFERPAAPYAVLHVGAGSPLRLWQAERWRALAAALARARLRVVWSAGAGETEIVRGIDPEARHESIAGRLDLAQLWHLLAGAALLITLDTGIAHLAKLVGTRTVALYGPGSSVLFGRGEFWRDAPFTEVTIEDFACRDQRHLFKRELAWVRRCNRSIDECPRARCMEAIGLDAVLRAAGLPGSR